MLLFSTLTIYADGKRFALVLGNQTYDSDAFVNLGTPENDATEVANYLKKNLQFELIGGRAVIDAKNDSIGKLLDEFYAKCENAEVVILYYSGHGAQYENQKDARILPKDVEKGTKSLRNSIALADIREYMKKSDASIIIYDACRNDPTKSNQTSEKEKINTKIPFDSLKFKSDGNAYRPSGHITYYAVPSGKIASQNADNSKCSVFTQTWLEFFKSESKISINEAFQLIQDFLKNKMGEDYKPVFDEEGEMKGSLFGQYIKEPVNNGNIAATPKTETRYVNENENAFSYPLYFDIGIAYPFSFQPAIGLNLGKEKHGFVEFSMGSNFQKTKEIYYYNTRGDIATEQRYGNLDIKLRGGYMWNLPKSNKFQYGLYAGYDCLIITGKYGANVHSLLGGVQIEYSPIHWLSLYGNAEFAPAVSKTPANNYKDIETLCPEIKDWTSTFKASFGVKFNIPTSKR